MKIIEDHDEQLKFKHHGICADCGAAEELSITIGFDCGSYGLTVYCPNCTSTYMGYADFDVYGRNNEN